MKRAFSLIELMLSIFVATSILVAVVMLYAPIASEFMSNQNFHKIRGRVAHPLTAIRNEVESARVLTVDSTKCYKLCLIDSAGNRVYYYTSGTTLYRKEESTDQTIACSSGKVFAQNIDFTQSTFSLLGDVLTVGLYTTGTDNNFFRSLTSVFPDLKERLQLVVDNFECNSLLASGWALINTSLISWSVVTESTGAIGKYWLREDLTSNQSTVQIAQADLPLGLSGPRVNNLQLKFQYRTQGTMDPGEYLRVYFYDGMIWNEVFLEDRTVSLSSLRNVVLDLSPYAQNNNNKIRFEGGLKKSNDYWIIDEIEVYVK